MGRKKMYTDRQVSIAKLAAKLARNAFAITDYHIQTHKLVKKAKLTPTEIKQLTRACAIAIDATQETSK